MKCAYLLVCIGYISFLTAQEEKPRSMSAPARLEQCTITVGDMRARQDPLAQQLDDIRLTLSEHTSRLRVLELNERGLSSRITTLSDEVSRGWRCYCRRKQKKE